MDEKEILENWCGHRDALPREFVEIDAESLGRQSKCWAQENREGLPIKFEEHCEGLPRN